MITRRHIVDNTDLILLSSLATKHPTKMLAMAISTTWRTQKARRDMNLTPLNTAAPTRKSTPVPYSLALLYLSSNRFRLGQM
jgi:hypothetical protein